MVAASVAHGLVEKYNKENGTRRIYPTRSEMSRGYAISVAQAKKRGLFIKNTMRLSQEGEQAEIAAADRFRPEMQIWLEESLKRLRAKTAKKRRDEKRSVAVEVQAPKSRRRVANPRRPHATSSMETVRQAQMSPTGKGYKVQSSDAKLALRKAGAEVGAALWTGSKWAGERLWAGTKVAAAATGRGLKRASKVGAKYTSKGLDWGAHHLEEYAARPNPSRRRNPGRMKKFQCGRCGCNLGIAPRRCNSCGANAPTRAR